MRSVLLRGTKTLASKLMQNTLNLEPRDSHITKQVDDIITKNFKSLHGSSVFFLSNFGFQSSSQRALKHSSESYGKQFCSLVTFYHTVSYQLDICRGIKSLQNSKNCTWIAFFVSSNCLLDRTTRSTCLALSSRRVADFSNEWNLFSNSLQRSAMLVKDSSRFSRSPTRSVHSWFRARFSFSITVRLRESAWRIRFWASWLIESMSPWWLCKNKDEHPVRTYWQCGFTFPEKKL